MIRFIASDLDGTLLNKDGTLPQGIFPLIRTLKEKNITFCAASGRQYGNLRRLFAPVADDIVYICENGSYIVAGKDTFAQTIPDDIAQPLIHDILDSGMQLLLSTPESSMLLTSAERSFADDIFYRLRNTCTVIPDHSLPKNSYIKISGFGKNGVSHLAPALQSKWSSFLHADIAGEKWLDFTLTNKGDGIRILSDMLHIPASQMAAFGDQYNDLSMLEKVENPFLMVNAPEELKRQYSFPICNNVVDTLRDLIQLVD